MLPARYDDDDDDTLVDPQKIRTHIFLTEIHNIHNSLFFFSGYEVDSVHEKLGP